MEFYKNLPPPARIGLPAVLVIVIALALYMMVLKTPPSAEVINTRDIDVYNVAKSMLDRKGIEFDEERTRDKFVLHVASEDNSEASQALAGGGIADRTGTAKAIECPAAPGFTATKAANERADNCAGAQQVQSMLLTAGAIAANVSVSQEENGTLLGPEKSINVVAQVFLPKDMKGRWNAEQAATLIAGAVGTSSDRVMIADDELQSLFDGTAQAKLDGASGSSGAMGLGCTDISSATEIETKKAAVRACYKQTIGDELSRLLGGSDRFVLTVEPTIDSNSSVTTSTTTSAGAVAARNSQTGQGSKAEAITSPPSTRERTESNPAGNVSKLRLGVALDKSSVSTDQVLAVRRLLQTHIDTRRGDPTPLVTLTTLAGSSASGSDQSASLEVIREQAMSGESIEASRGDVIKSAYTPKWILALTAGLVAGLAVAIFMLWRRSIGMATERKRIEESFQQDQRLFEDFASKHPDQLAQEMNALFGAPSAPEPQYR